MRRGAAGCGGVRRGRTTAARGGGRTFWLEMRGWKPWLQICSSSKKRSDMVLMASSAYLVAAQDGCLKAEKGRLAVAMVGCAGSSTR